MFTNGTDAQRGSHASHDGACAGWILQYPCRRYSLYLTEVRATTGMELTDETTCEVTIIAGGGGYGLTATTGGRETDEARKIRRRVETLCEERELTVERAYAPTDRPWKRSLPMLVTRLGCHPVFGRTVVTRYRRAGYISRGGG